MGNLENASTTDGTIIHHGTHLAAMGSWPPAGFADGEAGEYKALGVAACTLPAFLFWTFLCQAEFQARLLSLDALSSSLILLLHCSRLGSLNGPI